MLASLIQGFHKVFSAEEISENLESSVTVPIDRGFELKTKKIAQDVLEDSSPSIFQKLRQKVTCGNVGCWIPTSKKCLSVFVSVFLGLSAISTAGLYFLLKYGLLDIFVHTLTPEPTTALPTTPSLTTFVPTSPVSDSPSPTTFAPTQTSSSCTIPTPVVESWRCNSNLLFPGETEIPRGLCPRCDKCWDSLR